MFLLTLTMLSAPRLNAAKLAERLINLMLVPNTVTDLADSLSATRWERHSAVPKNSISDPLISSTVYKERQRQIKIK